MLTLDLVDRLLASTLVPREAKLAAVESWRREIAAIWAKDPTHWQLEQRLTEASRMLTATPLGATDDRFFAGVLARGAGHQPVQITP
jgi:hypothetical protein